MSTVATSNRREAAGLMALSNQSLMAGQAQIARSLATARLGIGLAALTGLFAFYLYLRQTHRLREAGERQQQALERELRKIAEDREARLERARAIIRETRTMWKPEYDGEELSITYKDHLYDEHGLPK